MALFRGNRIGLYLLVIGGLAAAYWLSPVRLGVACGDSMRPSFEDGEVFMIDRYYYRRRPVLRGDVVVLRHNGMTHMKRVAAVEGEALHLRRANYDGGPADELVMPWQLPRLRRMCRDHPEWMAGDRIVRRAIPRGHVYVLGDNLSVSEDSRRFGLVDTADIEGKVIPLRESRSENPRLAGSFRAGGRL